MAFRHLVIAVLICLNYHSSSSYTITLNNDDESTKSVNREGLPKFNWLDKSTEIVAYLQISFPDGGDNDVAKLFQNNPIEVNSEDKMEKDVDTCIYIGHLMDDTSVIVALNGCPGSDNFDIVLNSERIEDNMFEVRKGKVVPMRSVINDGGNANVTDSLVPPEDSEYFTEEGQEVLDDRALPTSGLTMKLSMNYDQRWNGKFGTGSINKMRRIINLAQAMFYWSSLRTQITLKVVEEKYINTVLTADSGISRAGQLSSSSSSNPNTFVYMSWDYNSQGTAGIAYVGTVCAASKYYRTAIVEYSRDDMGTAEVFAHELGHSLNMNHDFNGQPSSPRYDYSGRRCTGIGSVMDYYQSKVTKWSTCSVEDLNKLYSKVVSSTGRFCLVNNGGGGGTVSTTTTTTTTTTPKPTCSDNEPRGYYYCQYYWYYGCNQSYIKYYCKKSCGRC